MQVKQEERGNRSHTGTTSFLSLNGLRAPESITGQTFRLW